METFRFLEWQVYKDGKEFFKLVYGIVNKLPKDIRFDLGGQIIRASFSLSVRGNTTTSTDPE